MKKIGIFTATLASLALASSVAIASTAIYDDGPPTLNLNNIHFEEFNLATDVEKLGNHALYDYSANTLAYDDTTPALETSASFNLTQAYYLTNVDQIEIIALLTAEHTLTTTVRVQAVHQVENYYSNISQKARSAVAKTYLNHQKRNS